MAKISLHAYNREIENLIERGQTEEAIAHCKYILRQFPKHINTYRLLGKTYLESQRYSEAADILQRVLSSIPDDFVSQLGMSIIREDEGNLDSALWHMERAYEVQPANTAIQDELRRLYGRRDGVEPPKVRLTRGALVRMYARGELYTQAIAEARAAIAEDPQRIDLEIILAQMYYLADMKIESAEVCGRLVGKLPFCYEANHILAEILPSTSRAEDAKTFQQNLTALDPYYAFISPASPTASQVPENAVMVERLDWNPSEEEQQSPTWARTAGVDYQSEAADLPDWLDSLPASSLTAAPFPDVTTPPFEETLDFSADVSKTEPSDIPEWMRAAGWNQSSDETTEESTSVFDLAGEGEDKLAEAELPAWLREMAPADEDTDILADEQEKLDLLDSILPPETASKDLSLAIDEEQPEARSIFDQEQAPPSEQLEEPSAEAETPEWLNGLDVVEDSTIYKTGRTGALPKWLEDELESDAVEAGQLPEEELPEWLRTFEEESEPTAPEPPEKAPEEQITSDDEDVLAGIAWLESLAENQGAESETLLTSPEDRRETPPDWVTREDEVEEISTIGPPEGFIGETEPSEEILSPVDEIKPGEAVQPDMETFAPSPEIGMEPSLIGEAAQPDTEIFTPSPEIGMEPSFIGEAAQPDMETFAPSPEIGMEPSLIGEAAQPDTEIFAPSPEIGMEPSLIGEAAQPDMEIFAPSPEIGMEPSLIGEEQAETPLAEMDEDATFAWLESLAARQGADEETLLTAPEDRLETPPIWVYEETGEPASAAAETDVLTPEVEAEATPEFPGWLDEAPRAAEQKPVESESVSEEAAVDWFAELPIAPVSPPELEITTAEEPPFSDEDIIEEEQKLPEWFTELEPETADTAGQTAEWQAIEESGEPVGIETAGDMGTIGTELAEEESTQPVRVSQAPVVEVDERIDVEKTPGFEPYEFVEAAPPVPELEDKVAAETPEEIVPWAEEIVPELEPAEAELPSVLESPPGIQEAIVEQLASDDLPETIREQAFTLLDRGQIDSAIERYNQVIESGKLLDEVIEDLRKALDRHPVDIAIWQTLGDAHLRNDQVQEALDSYTKAEELLR